MNYHRIRYDTLKRFCEEAFGKLGFAVDESRIIVDVLLLSDLYGIESHGIQRIKRYEEIIRKGMVKIGVKPQLIFESPVSAVIDAQLGMGQLSAHYGMSTAIEKAKKTGMAIVSVRNSNHYGIAGYYAKMACDENMLGMCFTNSESIMVPTHGRQAMLGSNPIACAMPAEPYNYLYDASTTVVTRGKLEVYNKLGKQLPDGWALDQHGNPSTNAAEVLENIDKKRGGGIMPLGGNEEVLGSHKGYGLGMLSEIFSSIISLGLTSNYCLKNNVDGCCHGFIAIDPNIFGDANAIKMHLSTFLQELRDSPKAKGQNRIYTHGEKEVEAMKDRMMNGILMNDKTFQELKVMCNDLQMDATDYFEGITS